ncbi:MAG: GTPase, partial [Planctomycetota bacterium]
MTADSGRDASAELEVCSMEIGIVGLPNVGKSALFKALTGMDVEVSNYAFTTTRPIQGSAPVPDPRLTLIGEHIPTKKYVPATIDLVDIPALVSGSAAGEGMGNAFLEQVRQVDAMAHVVRCFEDDDVTHVSDDLDPVRDAEAVEVELLLADLTVFENARDKAERRARTGDAAAKKRIEVCRKAAELLESERPLRLGTWSQDEHRELRSLGMITMRPVLYIANVGEDDVLGEGPLVQRLRDWVAEQQAAEAEAAGTDAGSSVERVVPICAKLEAELAELEGEDRAEMLEAMGLQEPALAVLARALYNLLGLQSFYT